jgi:hypothetical protein
MVSLLRWIEILNTIFRARTLYPPACHIVNRVIPDRPIPPAT